MTALSRDARRLLPRSLARLLGEREGRIREELRRFPPDLARALAVDIPAGRLQPETLAALDYETGRVVQLLREGQVSEGLVRLGGLLRIPADLADPVLVGVPEGWPPGVPREYYALLDANLDRMPVVLDEATSLELTRADLPALWQSLLERSRPQAPVIRAELFRERPRGRPPPTRLPLPGLGGGLDLVLASGHRHRRHLAGGLARGPGRHHRDGAHPRGGPPRPRDDRTEERPAEPEAR